MAISTRLRYRILERDGFACRYCGVFGKGVELQVDHVIPRSRGGGDESWNLTAACRECNAGKSDKMPTDQTISTVREADLAYSHGPHEYWPCRICGQPCDVSDEAEWTVDHDWIDCARCNETICDAFDVGFKHGRYGAAVR